VSASSSNSLAISLFNGTYGGDVQLDVNGGLVSATGTGSVAASGFLNSTVGGTYTINVAGGSVTATGSSSRAIDVNGGPGPGLTTVNVTGGSVTATGDNSQAINLRNGGAKIVVDDGTVSASGSTVNTINMQSSAGDLQVDVNGGSVAATSTAAGGAAISTSAGSTAATTINVTGGSVTGTGEAVRALDVNAFSSSGTVTVNLTGGSVGTTGNNSQAISIGIGSSGTASLTIGPNVTVTASGLSAQGLSYASFGGTLDALVLGTLSAPGPFGVAAYLLGPATLTVGNGGTSGTLVGDVALNDVDARLRFHRSDAITYGGAIGGTGGLEIMTGTVTLTNSDNSYSGATRSTTAPPWRFPSKAASPIRPSLASSARPSSISRRPRPAPASPACSIPSAARRSCSARER
jgi:hypothetical protein